MRAVMMRHGPGLAWTIGALLAYVALHALFIAWYTDWAVYTLAESAQRARALGFVVTSAVDLPSFGKVLAMGTKVPGLFMVALFPLAIKLAALARLPRWSKCVVLFAHAAYTAFFLA